MLSPLVYDALAAYKGGMEQAIRNKPKAEAAVAEDVADQATIAAARAALTAAGEQWTPMREAVFAQLSKQHSPISAYDIADQLSQERGKRVAPNSVYRILDLFVAKSIAMRIESANAYLANCHPGESQDCVFLVCDQCGDAKHFDDAEVSRTVRALADREGFRADRPVLEIRGRCEDCS